MQLLIIFLLVLLNGLLAMSEIAVVSARQARLQEQADNGSSGAKAALEL
ncbi:MAG: CNNM domain-containing protein, partial [Chloroflexota bacterium]